MDKCGAEWVHAVQALGFPIVVALWFMLRTDKKIEALTEESRSLFSAVKLLLGGDHGPLKG